MRVILVHLCNYYTYCSLKARVCASLYLVCYLSFVIAPNGSKARARARSRFRRPRTAAAAVRLQFVDMQIDLDQFCIGFSADAIFKYLLWARIFCVHQTRLGQ